MPQICPMNNNYMAICSHKFNIGKWGSVRVSPNIFSASICLFVNEGWPLSGTFSISLCLLSSFDIFIKELQRLVCYADF